MKHKIKTGDTVAYSVKFLRSIGEVSGPLPFARGTVAELKSYSGVTLATINWNDPYIPEMVNVVNLTTVARIPVDAAINS